MSIGFLLALFLVGCGQSEVSKDLVDYINNKLPELAKVETDAVRDYESVSGKNFKNDEIMYNKLQDSVIPKYRDFVGKLEAIKPATKELQAVHEIYIQAANKQYSAFVQMSDALEKQDAGLLAQANDKLAEGRKGIRQWQTEIEALAKKNNVTFQQK
ncbi:hypothetical protein DFP93_103231 [Aneurinibacillus soli]|uniref:Uncharacterized protein n=2 Tax=Aneurinibacillus soli TaxID=1500254 RepID=A0A0U5AYU3_9BACL|nr:hypothetical protein DFP93_103231 [Aneurinibacillus soli]BAU28922.1 hypothetical protein CB4_03099 [Aneurinibacillus soli]